MRTCQRHATFLPALPREFCILPGFPPDDGLFKKGYMPEELWVRPNSDRADRSPSEFLTITVNLSCDPFEKTSMESSVVTLHRLNPELLSVALAKYRTHLCFSVIQSSSVLIFAADEPDSTIITSIMLLAGRLVEPVIVKISLFL